MNSQEEVIHAENENWSMDEILTSEIIYEGLVENYGKPAVDAVIKSLDIHSNDLSLGDNRKITLRILNGNI